MKRYQCSLVTLGIITLFTLLLLAGCGGSADTPAPAPQTTPTTPTTPAAPPSQPTPTEPTSLVLAQRNEFTILDPHKSSSAQDISPLMAIFDRLVEIDGYTGQLRPGLATEWSISDSGLVTTFKLRQDVIFHDGTAFNAEAVKANFDRIVDPLTESQSAVFGLGPFEESRVIDEYTIEVEHKTPYGPFLRLLATHPFGMASPPAIEEHGLLLGQNPVGSGPYKFVEWVGGSHTTLEKNNDYAWAPDFLRPEAYFDVVRYRFIQENSTRAGALDRGEIDIGAGMAANDFIRLRDSGRFETHIYNRIGMPPPGVFINVTRPPTDDLRVRRALIHAVDAALVRDAVFEGIPLPSGGIISTHAWAYNREAGEMYSYDPAKAEQLLDEAGWLLNDSSGYREKNGVRLNIRYQCFPGAVPTAEVIEALLRDIGVEMEIWAVDNPMAQKNAQEGELHLVWTQWGGNDPSALRGRYGSENVGSGWNYCHYTNPALDELFSRGEQETDDSIREKIYMEVQQILMEDATIIPLHQQTLLWVFRPGIKGFDPHEATGFNGFLANLHE